MQNTDETLIIRRSILARAISIIITVGIGILAFSFLSDYADFGLDSFDSLELIYFGFMIFIVYYSFWHEKFYINSEGIQPHNSDDFIPWDSIYSAKLLGFTIFDEYITLETKDADEPTNIPWPMNKPMGFYNLCKHYAAADNPLIVLLEKLLKMGT
jgi:hypothetical protein